MISAVFCIYYAWKLDSQLRNETSPHEKSDEMIKIKNSPMTESTTILHVETKPSCDHLFQKTVFNQPIINDLKFLSTPFKNITFELKSNQTYTEHGSNNCFFPNYCTPENIVNIIIPFRNRFAHKQKFEDYMINFLKYQHRAFCFLYVEQFDQGAFNRAKLLSVGVDMILKNRVKNYGTPSKDLKNIKNCFITHDIDLIPVTAFGNGQLFREG